MVVESSMWGLKIWQLFLCLWQARSGEVIQHDQWYFVSVSRPGQLWISHNVEHGCKMKRIHDQGGGMNSPRVGVGGPGRHKLCLWWWEPIPCHQVEKAFHFFELSTGWQIISEYKIERDHCNVTCWSMCVKFLLNTSNLKILRNYKLCTRWMQGQKWCARQWIEKTQPNSPKKFLLITR